MVTTRGMMTNPLLGSGLKALTWIVPIAPTGLLKLFQKTVAMTEFMEKSM